jgi:hypothetical protein
MCSLNLSFLVARSPGRPPSELTDPTLLQPAIHPLGVLVGCLAHVLLAVNKSRRRFLPADQHRRSRARSLQELNTAFAYCASSSFLRVRILRDLKGLGPELFRRGCCSIEESHSRTDSARKRGVFPRRMHGGPVRSVCQRSKVRVLLPSAAASCSRVRSPSNRLGLDGQFSCVGSDICFSPSFYARHSEWRH